MKKNVTPTIQDRDFVIATVAAPTILVEPVKAEETTAEGEVPTEGVAEGTAEDAEATDEGKDKTGKPSDDKAKAASGDKSKPAKPSEDKGKAPSGDKGKSANKETKKK